MAVTRSEIKAGRGSLVPGLPQTRKRKPKAQPVKPALKTSTPLSSSLSIPEQKTTQAKTDGEEPKPAKKQDIIEQPKIIQGPEFIERPEIIEQPNIIEPPANGNRKDAHSEAQQKQVSAFAHSPPPLTFTDGLPLPRFIVFDLDYTIWPFNIDAPAKRPYLSKPGGQPVVKHYHEVLGVHKDIPSILAHIADRNIVIGAASRGTRKDLALEMLSLLKLPGQANRSVLSVFRHLEVYKGSKIVHFQNLQRNSGLPYEEMLFFDDMPYNLDVGTLGVVMYLVKSGRRGGVSFAEIDAGVEQWRRRNGRAHKEGS